jgi:hypothetical protein
MPQTGSSGDEHGTGWQSDHLITLQSRTRPGEDGANARVVTESNLGRRAPARVAAVLRIVACDACGRRRSHAECVVLCSKVASRLGAWNDSDDHFRDKRVWMFLIRRRGQRS